MTDPVKEQLSACLDGELPPAELDLLLKQVQKDPATSSALGRYALISETLRSRRTVRAPTDFVANVRAAIDAEQSHSAPVPPPEHRPSRSHTWLRPVAGFAVAAGVAAIAILAIRPQSQVPLTQYAAETTQVTTPEDSESASYIVPASPAVTGYVPATRLTNYVVAHSEYSTPLGRRSVLSGVLAEDDPDPDADDDDATEASDSEPTPQQ